MQMVNMGRWLRVTRDQPAVTALLFHRFFADGESRRSGIDRLRRQLDWLRARYRPISLSQFVAALHSGSLPDSAVLVTSDDASIDILHAVEEFKAFEVPLSVFVCAGWTAAASAGSGEDLVARAASAIQWYDGDNAEIRCGDRMIALSPEAKARNIETVIAERDALRLNLEELCVRIEALAGHSSSCCTWDELRRLASADVEIGAHSVTHVNLALASAGRRRFEIAEGKRLCESLIGRCEAFAYPYGMADTHNAATRGELHLAGFSTAFLSHADFITAGSDPMTLPRFSIPNEPMSLAEFRARVGGAGIAMRRLKGLLRGNHVPAA